MVVIFLEFTDVLTCDPIVFFLRFLNHEERIDGTQGKCPRYAVHARQRGLPRYAPAVISSGGGGGSFRFMPRTFKCSRITPIQYLYPPFPPLFRPQCSLIHITLPPPLQQLLLLLLLLLELWGPSVS